MQTPVWAASSESATGASVDSPRCLNCTTHRYNGNGIKSVPRVPGATHWLCGAIHASKPRGTQMSDTSDSTTDDDDDYLSELQDGCGCAEVWEHLSEHRNEDDG